MRTIFYIMQKEFIQVFRNRMMLPVIFLMPLVQLLILSYAVTFEIKNIRLYITDNDNSVASRALLEHFRSSDFYHISGESADALHGLEELKEGEIHQQLVILPGFEKQVVSGSPARVQVLTDAINGSAAALMNAYTLSVIESYNREVLSHMQGFPPKMVQVSWRYWFNPALDYKTYMIPGILVLLVTLIGMFLAGMNVVREKEIGTIEQINVTPIRKVQFIAGKLLPFWIIALAELAFGLALSVLLFNIPIVGNIFLIFLVASVYLVVVMGLGLFISTITNTQQQSMFLSWFFLVIFILMSGLFTPVESMPHWALQLNTLNPIAYFIRIMRMIMLKGSGFQDIVKPMLYLSAYGITILSLAVWRYRKTS